MSGKKISEMTAITGAQLDQTNDVVPVLDVSDASNPNKKISIQELASVIGASGTTNVDLSLDGSNNLTLTDSDSNTVSADLSSLLDDTDTTNASLSLATNTLTLTDSASNSVDVDLSSLDNSGLTLADVTANGAVTNYIKILGASQGDEVLRLSTAVDSRGLKITTFAAGTQGNAGVNFDAFHITDAALSFSTKGTEALYINGSQNVGIKTTTPTVTLDIQGTDAVQLTAGTEAQRPTTPANGMIRYNSDANVFEGYDGEWGSMLLEKDFGLGTIIKFKADSDVFLLVSANGVNFTCDKFMQLRATDKIELLRSVRIDSAGASGFPAVTLDIQRNRCSTTYFRNNSRKTNSSSRNDKI